MHANRPVVVALASLLFAAAASGVRAQELPPILFTSEVVTLTTRPGVTVRYVGTRPIPGIPDNSVALIMFAGSNGVLNIQDDGQVRQLRLNFLIRSRGHFLLSGAGYVAAVDAPSDRQKGMNGAFRQSRPHAADLAKVIDDVRSRTGRPVWLVGTSAGTLSAASVAAQLQASASRADGVVLTSTMTHFDDKAGCGKTVFDSNLAAIRAPVLVTAHEDDQCVCTPPSKVDELLAALSGASSKEKKIFSGGLTPITSACEAQAAHGYYGIEKQVTDAIIEWAKPPQALLPPVTR
jgi:pimeloyl-ACP methyl ester carboxylesterase